MIAVDEKIAQLKMAKKKLKEENAKPKEEDIKVEEPEKTIEEIVEEIKSGKLTLKGKEFIFEEKEYLDGKIKLPIIKDFFKRYTENDEIREITNDYNGEKEYALLANETLGVAYVLRYFKEDIKFRNIKEYKKFLFKESKKMKIYLEWGEEGIVKKGELELNYVTSKSPMAMGFVYNIHFFVINTENEIIVGNINCFEEDKEVYGKINEAIIELIDINL